MNKDGDVIVNCHCYILNFKCRLSQTHLWLLLPLDTSCFFLSPVWAPPCFIPWRAQLRLSQWLLSWKCHRRPGESPSRIVGGRWLVCRVSVGVGSQWGLSFYRLQWRQNLLGKAIKPAALCVFECRLVGQRWPFNLTKLKEVTSSTCLQGCRFSVISLSFLCTLQFWKNWSGKNNNKREKALAHLLVFFVFLYI